MKFVSLLTILILSAACGQNGGSGSSSSSGGPQRNDLCSLNGRSVACASLEAADGQGVDLLEAIVDVPVKIENAEMTFLADKSSGVKGRRISCAISVKSGDVYRFALRGDHMMLMTPEGTFDMTKTSDGPGILGAWYWKGYVEQGTHMIRQLSVLSNSRVILRTSCEL